MSAYRIEVTCPACRPGTHLEPVVEGKACTTFSTAVAKCPICGRTYQVTCTLRVAGAGDGSERQRRSRRRRRADA